MSLTRAQHSKASRLRRREGERVTVDSLERRVTTVESVLIALTISAIAYADHLIGVEVSIGFLYLIPLSYSALSQRPPVTLALLVLCVLLRQWSGPLQDATTEFFIRDILLTFVFLSVVAALARLGHSRRLFFESAREQRDDLLRDVELAAEVQENILLLNRPPVDSPYDIAATMEPAKVVGGDYYDFVKMGDGRLGIVIADVAGKGLSAALLMPAAAITLQGLAASAHDPSSVLEELNRIFHESTGHANYATVFHASLDIHDGRLLYSSGGHLPGLLVRADGRCEWLTEGGTPVGLLAGAKFDTGETKLDPGDVLVLYTDGIAEVEDDSGEPFGEDRLAEIVAKTRLGSAASIEQAIRRAVHDYGRDDPMFDDATLIVVKSPQVRIDSDY